MDYIPPARQTAGAVSHKGTANDRGHAVAGQSDKPRISGQDWLIKH